MKKYLLLAWMMAAFWCSNARADFFTVFNVEDTGPGSLREAMQDANNNPGEDTIDIVVSGVIQPSNPLPVILESVVINGNPEVSIDGAKAGSSGFAAWSAESVKIYGDRMENFHDAGVWLNKVSEFVIEGSTFSNNRIGILMEVSGNIHILNNQIINNAESEIESAGCQVPFEIVGNEISGNDKGVLLYHGGDSSYVQITDNRILSNRSYGVQVLGNPDAPGSFVSMGGFNVLRNVLHGNGVGFNIEHAYAVLVSENDIAGNKTGIKVLDVPTSFEIVNNQINRNDYGVSLDVFCPYNGGVCRIADNFFQSNKIVGLKTFAMSNAPIHSNVFEDNGDAIFLENTTGDVAQNSIRNNSGHGILVQGDSRTYIIGNEVSENGLNGVTVESGKDVKSYNLIASNRISNNTGLGIDLGNNGVTGNDKGDIDAGPNDYFNFPLITSALSQGLQLTVNFKIEGPICAPGQTEQTIGVDFYGNQVNDPTGYGEGEIFLGGSSIVTDCVAGSTSHTVVIDVVSIPKFVSSTASQLGTSEFSRSVSVRPAAESCDTCKEEEQMQKWSPVNGR